VVDPRGAPQGVEIVSERVLGTMVTYGFPDLDLDAELALAIGLGAAVLEILPEWSRLPDPGLLRRCVADRGLSIHSAHGCWGGRTIHAARVDLGSIQASTHRASVDDLKRCVDWLAAAGGACPGGDPRGLSGPEGQPAPPA